MKYKRVRNTRRNALWGLTEKALSIFLPFLVRTALIRSLGVSYAGVSGLFTAILQVLNMAELGLGSAVIYCLYKPLAINDDAAVRALLRFYRNACRWAGFVMLGAGLTLTPFLKYLVQGSYPAGLNLYFVYGAYLLHSAVGFFVFPERKALLSALHRQDMLSKAAMLSRLFTGTLQLLALILARDYHLYILFLPLTALADSLLCAFWVKTRCPAYACVGEISGETRKLIREKIRGLLIHRICGSTRNAFDSLFISYYLGLAAVGIYGNYFYILTSVRGLLDAVTVAMSAGVGNSVAAESVEKNRKDLFSLSFLYALLCGWCVSCLLALYQPFMRLWCGGDMLLDEAAVIAFCVYFYVWTLGDIKSQYADARGLWWKDRYRSLCESASNLALNWLLVRFFGITGVVLATAISILFLGFPWSLRILFRDYFGLSFLPEYLRAQGLFALVTVGVCAVNGFVCDQIALDGLAGLILPGLICLVLPPALYALAYWKTRYFRDALPLIRALFRQ